LSIDHTEIKMTHVVANRLAEFTVKTQIGDLSPQALLSAKQLALKTVAGMLAGSSMDAGARVAEFVRKNPDGEQVGVVGHGFKASMWKAVFANAFFAHQSELEDDRLNTGTSWDITTFPMLLPLAQERDMSGAEMVVASAVGLEVMARTCQFFPQGYLGLSIVPPSIGPSALAARAMQLDVAQTAAAFGLAMSGIPLSYANFGTDAHFFETSMQTLHGLTAAQGASLGLSSNPDIVRFLTGLLGKERVDGALITNGLGQEWQFTEIWVKKYPCCLYTHRYIDGFLDLVREHNFSYSDLQGIRLHVAAGAMEVCNRPSPQTVGDLQFSFQHIMSAVAMDGDVNYRHIHKDIIGDPDYVQARTQVEVVVRSDWSARLPVETPALLEIMLKDGRVLTNARQYPTGTIQEPLSLDFVKGLFKKFVGENLAEADKQFVANAIGELETLDRKDVRHVLGILNRGRT
jgi:2-methylcitrate dehydratase PrpD